MLKKIITNKYLLIFIGIILIIFTSKISSYFSNKKIEAHKIEIKTLKIKNDILTKVADGHYRKLVADTLSKKELNKKIKELEIKVKDGVIVEKVVFVPITVEKTIDSLKISKDSIVITDYYPKKENWFTKYNAIVNLKDSTSLGKFTFGELPISLVISQQEDGTFKSDLKAPDFIKVSSLEILALPLESTKKDNFGFLVGGKVNKNFQNGDLGYEVLGGFRFKKVNIITSINTNEAFGIGTLIEF